MKYLDYAKFMGASDEVCTWITANLTNYLKHNIENQAEIEHIIDYLVSDAAPRRLKRASYDAMRVNAENWVKTLQKKGAHIVETDADIETCIDFGDGMRLVRLCGDKAFAREGYLMRHCAGARAGADDIYSLRDSDNMPHCTIQLGHQIKGKGNGSVHPKYIDYIVKSLDFLGRPMRESEMENIGYIPFSDDELDILVSVYGDLPKYNNCVFVSGLEK